MHLRQTIKENKKKETYVGQKNAATSDFVYRFAVYVSFGVFIFTLLTQIYVTNQLTVKGSEILDMAEKRSVLNKEISLLELEIAGLASLTNVETQAIDLGFVKNSAYVAKISSTRPTAALHTY